MALRLSPLTLRGLGALLSVLASAIFFSGCAADPGPGDHLAADHSPPPPQITAATPWPEADALFHRDPRWLGADCAYSLDLGHDRVLWLFGDTFIATSQANRRRESRMPRNTVAIQRGYNPATADIQFYWNTRDGQPGSFFPDEKDTWYWPGHGIRLENQLLIFLMKVQRVEGGLGFAVNGWTVVSIDNPDDAPDHWHLRRLTTPATPYNVIVGSASVLRIGEYVEAYSAAEPGPRHDIYLLRWPLSAVRRGDLSNPEWYVNGRWILQDLLAQKPMPVLTEAQTEFTVHEDRPSRSYLEIQTRGFGGADLVSRRSASPEGSWTPPEFFYRPTEAAIPHIMIYAAKAHPELTGADLVVTYATNNTWEKVLDDSALYYPRFLKVAFGKPGAPADKPAPAAPVKK